MFLVLPVCPVTDWTGWSLCTATCGYGHRMRSRGRTAVNKATMTSLIDCSQTHMQETMRCYAGACVPLDQLRGNSSRTFGEILDIQNTLDYNPNCRLYEQPT